MVRERGLRRPIEVLELREQAHQLQVRRRRRWGNHSAQPQTRSGLLAVAPSRTLCHLRTCRRRNWFLTNDTRYYDCRNGHPRDGPLAIGRSREQRKLRWRTCLRRGLFPTGGARHCNWHTGHPRSGLSAVDRSCWLRRPWWRKCMRRRLFMTADTCRRNCCTGLPRSGPSAVDGSC